MPYKTLKMYEGEFLKALSYADLYTCTLTLQQFACSRYLDPEEYETLRGHLEEHGISTE